MILELKDTALKGQELKTVHINPNTKQREELVLK